MTLMSRKLLVSMLGSETMALVFGGSVRAQDTTPAGSSQGMDKMGAMHSDMKGAH